MVFDGPRTPRVDELPAVAELVSLVFDDPAATVLNMADRFPVSLQPVNRDNIYVLFADGRPVSSITTHLETLLIGGCRLRVGTLGMVCTHPDHRGQHHAGTVLQAAYDGLRRKGAAAVLISGWRSLYTASGGARVWPHYEAVVERPALRVIEDASLAVERVSAANRAEVVALHEAEPVRFEWSEPWQRVVLPALMESRVGTGLLVRQGGRAVAAACVLHPVTSSGSPTLLDWFGDRRAAVMAAGRLMTDMKAERMRSAVVEQDAAMVEALTAAGFAFKRFSPPPWTLKVLDFPALLAALAPHVSARLGQGDRLEATAGGFQAGAGGEVYTTPDEPTAVKLLFASPQDREDALGSTPPAVRGLLSRIFPVPLRHYGVNYL